MLRHHTPTFIIEPIKEGQSDGTNRRMTFFLFNGLSHDTIINESRKEIRIKRIERIIRQYIDKYFTME